MTTNQLSNLFGVSIRRLQWLNERHVVRPSVLGHTRDWSAEDALLVGVIAALRAKGLSLQAIRRSLPKMRAGLEKSPAPTFLLANEHGSCYAHSGAEVVEVLARLRRGALVVDLAQVRRRVYGPEKAMAAGA